MNNRTKSVFLLALSISALAAQGQVSWKNVDSLFGPLPASVHVYRTMDSLDGKPNIAYYVEADLNDKRLSFTTDTTYGRRLKPSQFHARNGNPLVVVNTTFFSFGTNQNLNVVIKDGKLVGYNIHTLPRRGKDTLTYNHPFGSAIGIAKNRKADVAWLYTDSSLHYAMASQQTPKAIMDSMNRFPLPSARSRQYIFNVGGNGKPSTGKFEKTFLKWNMETAVGGGPVLVQQGEMRITNNEELKFAGKAINDRHPRTAMGYTKDNRLIILVVEGRHPGKAEGATLVHLAAMLRGIGCWEALNLDGGGSSCMLVNGKETIRVSDPGGQRSVPAVFIIKPKL